MKKFVVTVGLTMWLWSMSSFAAINYTDDKIEYVAIYFGQILIKTSSSHGARCGGGNNSTDTFLLRKQHADYKEMYSALLTAKIANKQVQFLTETASCVEFWGTEYPELIAMFLMD
jgi:hypothetical protein